MIKESVVFADPRSAFAREFVDSSSDVLDFVAGLLDKGEVEPKSTQIGQRLVSYWPMRIAESCATCHLRNGLEQKVGAFGGATIVVVEPRF
jgi:hypothetical protein